MEGETVVGNPSSIRVVRVILKFFSAGNEIFILHHHNQVFITGSRTIAASITLKSGLKTVWFQKMY